MPGESLNGILDQYVLDHIPDQCVLAITSKIISVCQNQIVLKTDIADKFELIKKEAEYYLEGKYTQRYGICLSIKNHILIPTAGIDESNGNGYYILYPANIQQTAIDIWLHLKKHHPKKQLGVLITDSHTTPLRRGVTGIGLGWCGFEPLFNYVGKPDIFGEPFKATQINMLDSLAASAVFVMGEGAEQTPLALLTDLPRVEFVNRPPNKKETELITIAMEDDLYQPLLSSVAWQKGQRSRAAIG